MWLLLAFFIGAERPIQYEIPNYHSQIACEQAAKKLSEDVAKDELRPSALRAYGYCVKVDD